MLEKTKIKNFQEYLKGLGWEFKAGNRSIAFQAEKDGSIVTFEKTRASYKPYDQDITGRGDARRLIKEFNKTIH